MAIKERVLSYLQQLITDQVIPGATGEIITSQATDYFQLGGRQAVPQVEPFTNRQPLYDVASLTKVVGTVPLILQLVQSGQLMLTDSVSKFLPAWQSPQVTIRHLLTHTSDIVGYISRRDQLNSAELTTGLLGLTAGSQIGQRVRYQDVNFILLGWIAEAILGQSVHELITQRIIRPLGMPDATFEPQKSQLDVIPTSWDAQRGLLVGRVHDPKTAILRQHSGAAGLFASVADLDVVVRWLLGKTEHPAVLPNEVIRSLFEDQTPTQTGDRSFGWDLRQTDSGNYIAHTGFTGPLIVIDRGRQSALILLTNRVNLHSTRQEYKAHREKLIQYFLQ